MRKFNKHHIIAFFLSIVLAGLIAIKLVSYFSNSDFDRELSSSPPINPLDIVWGKSNAPVTIFLYSSYTCKYCTSFFQETFPQLKKEYIDQGKIKLVLKLVELPEEPETMRAIQASVCINQFADFEKFHELLTINPEVIYSPDFRVLLDDIVATNPDIAQCLLEHEDYAYVHQNNKEFRSHNFKGTPTFVIGEKVFNGMPHKNQWEDIFFKTYAKEQPNK